MLINFMATVFHVAIALSNQYGHFVWGLQNLIRLYRINSLEQATKCARLHFSDFIQINHPDLDRSAHYAPDIGKSVIGSVCDGKSRARAPYYHPCYKLGHANKRTPKQQPEYYGESGDEWKCRPNNVLFNSFRHFCIVAALPEVILRNCRNCSPQQAQNAQKLTNFLQTRYPDVWAMLIRKYRGD